MEGVERRQTEIVVRGLTPEDLDAVVAIERKAQADVARSISESS